MRPRREATEVAALHDPAQHPFTAITVSLAEHLPRLQMQHLTQQPHQRTRRSPQSECFQHVSHRFAVFLRSVPQQQIVVAYLPQPDASGKEMVLDMSQLHHQRKLHRWYEEFLWHHRRMQYLLFHPALQPSVRDRVEIARRRSEMHLHRHARLVGHQMHVVIRGRGLAFNPCPRQITNQTCLPKQFYDTLAPAFHPDVDITGLPTHRVGIEPCVRLSFQDGRPPPIVGKQSRQPCRLAVQQTVQSTYRLRLAGPLHGHHHRGLLLRSQSRHRRIDHARQRLLPRHLVECRPLRLRRNSRRRRCLEGFLRHRRPQQRKEQLILLLHIPRQRY